MHPNTKEVVSKYLIALVIGVVLIVAASFIGGFLVSNKEEATGCAQYGMCFGGALLHLAILILGGAVFLIIWTVLFITNLVIARKKETQDISLAHFEQIENNLKIECWLIALIYLLIPYIHLFIPTYIGFMSPSLGAGYYLKLALFYSLFIAPISVAVIWAVFNLGSKINQIIIKTLFGFLPIIYVFIAFESFSYRFGYSTLQAHIDEIGWATALNFALGLTMVLLLLSLFLCIRCFRKLNRWYSGSNGIHLPTQKGIEL